MNKQDKNKIIRQRTSPSIFDYCFITTRAHLQVFYEFKNLLRRSTKSIRIVDIGCGYKPFKRLLKGIPIDVYIGVDFDTKRSAADIVGSADNLALEDNSFDAVIISEVLEHTLHLEKAINEIRRVAKDGALVYVSTPFIFGEHGVPYDYQRITRYKYREMFKNDEIIRLKETNSSLATPGFISNVVLENIAAIKLIPIIPQIYYFTNNVTAVLGEALVALIKVLGNIIFHRRQEWFNNIMQTYFYKLPGGFDVIVRIKK